MEDIPKKNQPLVSVGICSYNRPEGLKTTIDCICSQTYTNLEIIISDDYSTNPEVYKIIDYYLIKDRRIKFFKKNSNEGMTKNFNSPFKISTGYYFMWAADDDIWDPTFIMACMQEHLKDNSLSLVYTNAFLIDKLNNITGLCDLDLETIGLNKKEKIIKIGKAIHGKPNIAFYGIFNKKKVNNLTLHKVPANDIIFTFETILNGNIKYLESKNLFSYRMNGFSVVFTDLLKVNKIDSKLIKRFPWTTHYLFIIFIILKNVFYLKHYSFILIKIIYANMLNTTNIYSEIRLK